MAKKATTKKKTKTSDASKKAVKAEAKTTTKSTAKAAKTPKPTSKKPAADKTTRKRVKNTDLTPVIVANHDQVAAKAYEIWLAKGRPFGQDEQNWLEAEAAVAGKK